jgi:uncharacterized protein (TIGR02145 family)
MRKCTLILVSSLLIGLLFLACKKSDNNAATEKVAIKAQLNTSGSEVTIGNQIWMTKNLNVDTFRNGDTIPEAKSAEEWVKAIRSKQPAWCYYNNDSSNGEKYGKLYNWYAVNDKRGLAPNGWHVSSDEEWTQLTDNIGGMKSAAVKMKAEEGWADVKFGAKGNEGYYTGNGNNKFYFSALPGGSRSNNGDFSGVGESGFWWTSTSGTSSNAWNRSIFCFDELLRHFSMKDYGYSVRCLKD